LVAAMARLPAIAAITAVRDSLFTGLNITKESTGMVVSSL
jgi:hypothetical protein